MEIKTHSYCIRYFGVEISGNIRHFIASQVLIISAGVKILGKVWTLNYRLAKKYVHHLVRQVNQVNENFKNSMNNLSQGYYTHILSAIHSPSRFYKKSVVVLVGSPTSS